MSYTTEKSFLTYSGLTFSVRMDSDSKISTIEECIKEDSCAGVISLPDGKNQTFTAVDFGTSAEGDVTTFLNPKASEEIIYAESAWKDVDTCCPDHKKMLKNDTKLIFTDNHFKGLSIMQLPVQKCCPKPLRTRMDVAIFGMIVNFKFPLIHLNPMNDN